MKLSISNNTKDKVISSLQSSMSDTAKRYPGETSERQPVHTLYGGANLYKSDTAERLGKIASRSFDSYASDSETFAKIFNLAPVLANSVFERVAKKLTNEAVEDFRIDFEDGYGVRSDAEEDVHAISAAEQLAIGQSADTLPPFVGIRIKGLNQETHLRGIRTLDLFLTEFVRCSGAKLPENFVVTLPKVSTLAQVTALADILDELESNLGLTNDSIKIELMIETTQSLIDPDGFIGIPKLYESARGRCRGAHFGAYDYTSSCNVTAANQDLLHPLCDFARQIMQVSFAETGVWLSDGATNILPVDVNRGENLSPEQLAENRTVVHRAWKQHYDDCRHSLANGFYQGWDLHPAQLPSRYAANFAFFLAGLDIAAKRLRNFVEKAARATLVADMFDDAATGQGLLNYFVRAVNCGAIRPDEAAELTGVSLEALQSGSFVEILNNRKF